MTKHECRMTKHEIDDNAIIQIFAGSDVATAGLFAVENVTVKHPDRHRGERI